MSQTKLETYLIKRPAKSGKCGCGIVHVLKMGHSVFLGCPKCNRPSSIVINHQKAQEIQNGK